MLIGVRYLIAASLCLGGLQEWLGIMSVAVGFLYMLNIMLSSLEIVIYRK